MLARAKKILEMPVCNHCLGRQFSQLLSGHTNAERGSVIRHAVAMAVDAKSVDYSGVDFSNFTSFKFRHNKDLKDLVFKERLPCAVCNGLFESGLDKLAGRVAKAVRVYELTTFLVGTRISNDLLEREEKLWEKVGIEYCEPLRAEVNREVGKLVEKLIGRKAELKAPDIAVLIDFEKNKVEARANPIYIYGRYQKLVRGIPQCRWGTPGKYKTSVEQVVGKPILAAAAGLDHRFHGAGREDIDALCFAWRPFVLEILEPRKRTLDLKKIIKIIARSGKVKVKDLKMVPSSRVAEIKALRSDKTYRVLVNLAKPIRRSDLAKLKKLKGNIAQKTPERVLHRRADLDRTRKVLSIRATWKTPKKLVLEIKGTAGIYIKELVSGDNGRTKPNVSDILGVPAKVKELDVIKIGK